MLARHYLTGFNPHPLRRAGATPRHATRPSSPRSFNPHPLRRAGATPTTTHSRGRQGVSILTRSEERVQRVLGETSIEETMEVSILTRSEERVQPCPATSSSTNGGFQSSPAPKSGCNHDAFIVAPSSLGFQSSPAPKSGCNLHRRQVCPVRVDVSILTRSEERVQRGAREVDDSAGSVSILTRSEERVQPSLQSEAISAVVFQSSPAPKSGCNASIVHLIGVFVGGRCIANLS